jgi:alpha-galactosidase
MTRIAFIGAGSTVFMRNLLRDLYLFPALHHTSLALMDIDAQRLRDSEIVARRAAAAAGAHPKILATTDRRRALDGADYVVNMIQVGGYEPSTMVDFEVPKRYGLRQTIADTLGIGGIMRGLRTIPVVLDIAHDMQTLCADALLLNYTNPMAMLTWAVQRATPIKSVGLCHSVQHTAEHLARVLGVPYHELRYRCAGINHLAFFLRFDHGDTDLYPRLRTIAADPQQVPPSDRVRFEILKRFGYFVTESSEHFAEYGPWFIKRDRPDLIERFNIPLDEYPRRCRHQIADWEGMRSALLDPDPQAIAQHERIRHTQRIQRMEERGDQLRAAQLRHELVEREAGIVQHSGEYGTLIMHAMETGQPCVINGNVVNHGLISNLPADCCVEVPCLVDANGIQPTPIGALPPQLAALMQTNINVQALTVEAALTGKREHIYHAAMLDPHTAAELDLEHITALVDDLIDAHGEYLAQFQGERGA